MELTFTPTSELEAINDMLSAVMEAPIASIEEVDGVTDAQIARQILHTTSRDVQKEGWSWNTDYEIDITPDVDGQIIVPTNTLRIDTTDKTLRYVVKDGKLWDRDNRTFDIDETTNVTITYFLPFEELPAIARSFIATAAAQKFEARTVNDPAMARVTATDVLRARTDLDNEEADTTDANVITDSWSVYRVTARRKGY